MKHASTEDKEDAAKRALRTLFQNLIACVIVGTLSAIVIMFSNIESGELVKVETWQAFGVAVLTGIVGSIASYAQRILEGMTRE